ncbi:MAG: DUF1015 domain-containing protein [Fimbriiglobus sp.]|jgi:uncharacterized protein (DUF1015 family)|nr:DUF1015 domain-containing protein [Fimbriiglobus sp.]
MADIRAFRGFRYDLGKVGTLAEVVCPPYDVIDGGLQQKLYDDSPYNAVRVELTREDPATGEDKYAHAARTLNGWVFGGVLQQDTARSLYVYEQQFTVEGQTYTRRGFLARVRLEPFGTGRIYPHEQTLSGPKADRLKLYQATGFNISPVFGLYPDETNEVAAALEAVVKNAPPLAAKDHLGVMNRLWVVTDQAVISKVIGQMGPKPVFIADGHHRYETGLKYKDEVNPTDDEHPANFCLMMLVGMSDPGLIILPTHRLVSGLPEITREQMKAAVTGHFDVVGEFDTAAECWEHVQLEDTQSVLGFGTVADGQWLAVKLRDAAVMGTLAADQSAEWRGLAVSILHKLVLEKLVPEKIGGTPTCTYVHLLKEVTDAVAAKQCQLACLVPPCGMEHVEEIAGNREKMPPKSTYFYPKVLTGLVFHSLKKD